MSVSKFPVGSSARIIFDSHARARAIAIRCCSHALYRVNLDGTNKMIAAYEVSGIGLEGSHFDFTVKDEWAYGKNYRIRLGNPANGFEKIELLEECDNDDWIYYVTNRLIKARKDGTEQIELDGVDSYDYQINNIDKEWVYYTKGGERYKIKKDATIL